MIDPTALRRRPRPIDRSSDRLVAMSAIGLAVGFLLASAAASFLPIALRRGAWLPLHLALAGAAGTAIAGIMPFFSAAFAAAPPIDARIRSAAVAAVALGAVSVSVGVVGSQVGLAVAGGGAFVGGIVLTGIATVRPLRRGLGPSRGLISKAYVLALVEVGMGSSIATLFLAGWRPLVQDWAGGKPAHAWLNLVGFASLVVATTLLHFFPTVVGARISARPSARITVVGLGAGAPLVALGFGVDSDILARLGAVSVAAGAAALAVYAWRTWQTRARWTTDPGWHRFAMGGLVSAIAWFEVGMGVATGRVVLFGADPVGWTLDAMVGPLVAGWIALTIVASATHLVPAVGPGDPAAHARQRRLLGRTALTRLVAANLGVAALTVGVPYRLDPLVLAGAILVAISLFATAGLIGMAVRIGVRRPAP